MKIEISNETYLKIKNYILEVNPNINEDKIQEYLVQFIDEKSTLIHFGGYVAMKELEFKKNNERYSLQCENCNHSFENNEQYFVVYEGKVGEEKLCQNCFNNYRYDKSNLNTYIYKE